MTIYSGLNSVDFDLGPTSSDGLCDNGTIQVTVGSLCNFAKTF